MYILQDNNINIVVMISLDYEVTRLQRTIYVPDELWIPFQKQSIDRKKSVSDRIRDFVKKIHQAFFDGFEVRISILPVDTKKEYVGSIDNEYDHDRGSM